ncbi:hypothetical protein [uncultured Acidaminococcus sp.]|uniref:hypothetical protein n=1 Tax=uncultured Acidaminococcus sp. TaxID=352152 RepID=UPI00266F64B2|nr:hypothetical protein [uncultured Acidaminococcus sp.]
MEKEKMEQCKARLVEAAQWGRKQITPQRLKKGAGCLVALAIVVGGGKFAMHKAKAEAKLQEAQAKTRMLQNMAAQQNITLVSTDTVKENIASTLGTDPSSITFQSITLDDRKPGEKKEDRKDSKKEKKQEKKDGKRQSEDRKGAGRQAENRQGQPGENGQPGQNGERENRNDSRTGATSRQPGMPRPEMAKAANAFPGVYLARCEKDGMGYQFLVDAQSGQVLHGQVHKLNPIQQKAGWWR